MRRLFVVVSIVFAYLSCLSSALAQEGPRLRFDKRVEPLDGAVAFCKELPSRCEPHAEAQMVLDQGRLAELVFINLIVNIKIEFQQEPPGVDVWQDRDFRVGDCEDIALLKRRELIALGWPPGALRLVIVMRKPSDSELHMVLVASTDRGDFVLDVFGKETGQLRAWNSKEFHELRMVQGADAKWYALLEPPALTVGSAK